MTRAHGQPLTLAAQVGCVDGFLARRLLQSFERANLLSRTGGSPVGRGARLMPGTSRYWDFS